MPAPAGKGRANVFVKKYLTVIFSLVFICSMLAACGGSNTASTSATPTSASSATAPSTGSASGSISSTGSTTGSTGSTGSAGSSTDSSTGSTGSSASSSPLLQVVQSAYYVSSDTQQGHVIGIAKNISGGNLFGASVKVSLLDDSGASLADGSATSFDDKLLPANAQGGFDILFNTPPAKFAKMAFSFDGQPYTAGMTPAPALSLTVSDDSISDSGLGTMQVTCTVNNKGSKDANNVYVTVAFLDNAGNVLDVSQLIAGSDGTVPAGGTAKTIVGGTRSGVTPTKYQLYVAGSEN